VIAGAPRWAWTSCVFLLACIQYVNTVSHDYAWDDKLAITANDYTKRGIRGLPDIFTKRVSVPFKSEYRPVPQALHAIEYQVFGRNPHVGHVFNVLWYAVTCVMVYAFARFVFPRFDAQFAFLVALLFLVHPLHVEVVANIKSRDEILASLLGLSSIILLVTALERSSWRLVAAGGACFAAACLSKANAVALLPMTALVAWYRSNGVSVSRRLAVGMSAVAGCSIACVAAIRASQSSVSPDVELHLTSTILNNIFLWTARPDTIVPTALVNIARYASLFAFPHPLIHLYGYDQIPLSTWRHASTWIVILCLVGCAVLVWKTGRRKLPLAFGLVWAAVTYAPYSNLFFYAPDTMADRYMFIPSVGVAIVAAYAAFQLARVDLQAPAWNRPRARVVLVLCTAMVVAYSATTYAANMDWKNDSTLIHSRIQYMENNAAAQAVYGYTLHEESLTLTSTDERRERKREAMRAYTRAIRIYPDFQGAWLAIGKLFAEEGVYEKAELSFLKAQRIEPLNPDSYVCLGTLYLAVRDHERAVTYLEKAVLLDPKMEEGYVMLGRAYLQAGEIDNLGAMATSASKWFPENTELAALLATYYFRSHDYAQAFALASGVMHRDPGNLLASAILSSPMVQELRRP
jgi:hypothetical protein